MRKLFATNRERTSAAISYVEWPPILADCAACTTFNKPKFSHKSNQIFTNFNKEGFREHFKTSISKKTKMIESGQFKCLVTSNFLTKI